MALSDLHKERIRTLANYLREKVTPEHFDMSAWWRNHRTGYEIRPWSRSGPVKEIAKEIAEDCGTAACVAGWAALLWPEQLGLAGGALMTSAGDYLGLSEEAAEALFTPSGFAGPRHGRYTVTRAVETLERLADTGKVQWWPRGKPVEA